MLDLSDLLGGAARYFFVDLIWEIILFQVGRVTLLVVTLGRFPRGEAAARHADTIPLAGIPVLLLACAVFTL